MKKSTKIIIPALAMLVLGTAAAATGTVAWFASNGTVKATGMKVQCTTAKNLLIANAAPENLAQAGSEYGVSVATKHETVDEISPASTTKSEMAKETPSFFKTDTVIDAVTGNVVANDEAAGTAGTTVSAAEESKEYLHHEFWLMAQATDDMNLSIKSVTVSEALNEYISQSLRMGIRYVDATATENNVHSDIFNLGTNGDISYAGFKGLGELTTVTLDGTKVTEAKVGDQTVTETVTPSLSTALTNYTLGKIKATTEAKAIKDSTWSKVDLYFWYEGQDSHCTAGNALSTQEITVDVEFEAKAA